MRFPGLNFQARGGEGLPGSPVRRLGLDDRGRVRLPVRRRAGVPRGRRDGLRGAGADGTIGGDSGRDGGLGRGVGRPDFRPFPAPLLRLALCEMGQELLLSGQGVRPSRLLDAGFAFRSPGLEAALRAELGLLSRR